DDSVGRAVGLDQQLRRARRMRAREGSHRADCATVAHMRTLLLLAALLSSPSQAKTVSKTGIPYIDEAKAGPPDLLEAIKSRRPGGKLLNLDRMLLHSPNFTKGWNTMFAAIRGQLALPGKLREIPIMAIAVLNKAEYEWAQHEPEFLKAGGTKDQLAVPWCWMAGTIPPSPTRAWTMREGSSAANSSPPIRTAPRARSSSISSPSLASSWKRASCTTRNGSASFTRLRLWMKA